MTRHDGSVRSTLITYMPDFVDGHVRGFFAMGSDITELKQAESQLTAMNGMLSLRAKQAEAAVQSKEAFVANINERFDQRDAAFINRFDGQANLLFLFAPRRIDA